MLPHGPDHEAFEAASRAELRPQKLEGSLAFMFETRFPQRVTRFAAEAPERQRDYGLYGTAAGAAVRSAPTVSPHRSREREMPNS